MFVRASVKRLFDFLARGRKRPLAGRPTLEIEPLEPRATPSTSTWALDPGFGIGGQVVFPFSPGAASQAKSVTIQVDGKIVVAGQASAYPGAGRVFSISRLNADGSFDSGFGVGGTVNVPFATSGLINETANALDLQPDGKIVVVGDVGNSEATHAAFGVVRLNPDGSLDTTFQGTGQGTIDFTAVGEPVAGASSVQVEADGSIVLAGTARTQSTASDGVFAVTRLLPCGALDPTFAPAVGGLRTISLAPNVDGRQNARVAVGGGKILVAGTERTSPDSDVFAIVRLTPAGDLDNSFGINGVQTVPFGAPNTISATVSSMHLQGDGKIVLAGTVTDPTATNRFTPGLSRLTADGALDPTFGAGGKVTVSTGYVSDMALERDGKIVVLAGLNLIRLTSNGSLDPAFGYNGVQTIPAWFPDNPVTRYNTNVANALTMQADGKIVVAGYAAPPFQLATMALARMMPLSAKILATGADAGGGPNVNVYDATTHALIRSFFAYDSRFTGGVRVAVGDVTGDGNSDIITAPGPGGGPDIHVYDGATGQMVRQFFAFNSKFTGGCYVAAGDVNGDGCADVIVGADAGGGPNVIVFSGKDGSVLANFFAFHPQFTGGVRVAAGDVTAGGIADIIAGAGPGGGPDVAYFDGANATFIGHFFAFDPSFTGGVYVAAADLNNDGRAEIIAGAGAGGGPEVSVWQAGLPTPPHTIPVPIPTLRLASFFAYDPRFTGGVRVAIGAWNNDGRVDIFTAPGPGGGPDIHVVDPQSESQIDQFFAFDANFTGGVFIGAAQP